MDMIANINPSVVCYSNGRTWLLWGLSLTASVLFAETRWVKEEKASQWGCRAQTRLPTKWECLVGGGVINWCCYDRSREGLKCGPQLSSWNLSSTQYQRERTGVDSDGTWSTLFQHLLFVYVRPRLRQMFHPIWSLFLKRSPWPYMAFLFSLLPIRMSVINQIDSRDPQVRWLSPGMKSLLCFLFD